MKNKLLAALLAAVVFVMTPFAVLAEDVVTDDKSRVVDYANLINEIDEANLESKLNQISEKHNVDVIVYTVNSISPYTSVVAYADDVYDYNGYGLGTGHDGVMLLISMESRDWYITTCGFGIKAFTDAGIEYMGEQFVGYLSDGDFAGGFNVFATYADDFITRAKNGNPFDVDDIPKEPFNWVLDIVISLIVGIVIAAIATGIEASKLKSVARKHNASDYYREGSMNLTEERDSFMYRHVDKRKKPENNSSGGSSIHISSSGRSHGGGGGKF